MFSHAIHEAELLPSDLAKLIGVNRCTVSFWFGGRSSPHVQLLSRVKSMLDLIVKATDAGDLPVPHDVKRRERAAYIQAAIAKQGHVALAA